MTTSEAFGDVPSPDSIAPPLAGLALDLGTSAFKCAPVCDGRIVGTPIEVACEIDRRGEAITVEDPEKYTLWALEALRQGAKLAREAGVEIGWIGICSQAQTFVAVDADGQAQAPAIVWLDERAGAEADELAESGIDFGARTGFSRPSPQQFLPKVLHEARRSELVRACSRVLLLNEFVIQRLTDHAYGDTTLQGMGGFFDIAARRWSEDLIARAGIQVQQLAPAFPAATHSVPLNGRIARDLGQPQVPVYSCGNDQCCSAIGAGVSRGGEVACTFGTAMVVYTVGSARPEQLRENQIAGIDPLTGGYFLLGYDSECGSAIDRARRELAPGQSIDEMIRRQDSPRIRDLLADLAKRFGRLLGEVAAHPAEARLIATGGLSRSAAWLEYLETTHGIRFERAPHGHSSLLGIARVIERQRTPKDRD